MVTISYVAGKSGGHILPALAQAQQRYSTNSNLNILFFTSSHKLDNDLLQRCVFISKHIALPLGRFSKLLDYPLLAFSFFISVYNLIIYRPSLLVSTGGVIAVPVCLAAWLLHIPIELQELNATPGRAVKFLARFATNIVICFPEAQSHFSKSCKLYPYPLRFINLSSCNAQESRKILNLDIHKKTLLILGGSQGSQFLNKLIQEFCECNMLNNQNFQVIHQTGNNQIDSLDLFYKQKGIQALVFSYRSDLALCYQATDIAICRAGAGTLFELLHFRTRSFIIPLELASTDHQYYNAQSFAMQHPKLFGCYRQKELAQSPQALFQALLQELAIS